MWDGNCKALHTHVKERAPALAKAGHKEKQNGEFTPCLIVQSYGDIEDELWKDHAAISPSWQTLNCSLRHRCCCLFLSCSVLRSESLHKAETSDFFGLTPPKKHNDVHELYLQINQIAEGETTHGNMQWGRATRAKDVR